MPQPSTYIKKKLNDTIADISSDEAILYELEKHVETFNLGKIHTKIYFNEVDMSMSQDAKVWMNYILPGRFPQYHSHDCYEFNFIFDGKCIEIVNGNTVYLEKGDILILPSNTVFHTHYLKNEGRGCNMLVKSSHVVAIRDELSGTVKENFLDILLKKNGFCVIHTGVCHDLLNDVEELAGIFYEEYEKRSFVTQSSELSRKYAESTFHHMIMKIFRGIENGSVICNFSVITQGAVSSEEIITYIKDNHASVSMPELSKKFGYSLSQLDRIIKKHTGNSFTALVTYERILHAKNLLKNTAVPVSEIAKAIGFDSKEYFSSMYKRQTGVTPTEYRKNHKNNNNRI